MSAQDVLLIGGVGVRAGSWEPVCDHLRAAGLTPHIVPRGDVTDLDQLVELHVRQLPETFAVVGHSAGGFIAEAIALKYPQRVTTIMLLDASIAELTRPPIPGNFTLMDKLAPLAQYLVQKIHDAADGIAPGVHRLRGRLSGRGIEMLVRENFAFYHQAQQLRQARESYDATPPRVSAVVCVGRVHTGLWKRSQQRHLRRWREAGAEVDGRVLRPAKHMVMEEQPQVVATLIADWMEGKPLTAGHELLR